MNNSASQQLLRNPLIIALDLDQEEKILELSSELADVAGAFKLGPRILNLFGPDLVKKIVQKAPVFLDCKYFDIPSVTVANVQSAFDLGATLVTVHAMVGSEALQLLAQLEEKLNQIRPFKILCVTLLTSFDQTTLPSNLKNLSISDQVKLLAEDAQKAGLNGIVCSPQELDLLQGRNLFIVTPGIRFSLQPGEDQKRTLTPHEAMQKGASALVVGRPILEASSPRQAALDFSIAVFTEK